MTDTRRRKSVAERVHLPGVTGTESSRLRPKAVIERLCTNSHLWRSRRINSPRPLVIGPPQTQAR